MDCIQIAVLGTGNVGRTLAAGWAGAGHEVTAGGRDPGRADLIEWADGAGVTLADHATAASGAEVVVVATAWDGTENALTLAAGGSDGGALDGRALDGSALDGKVLIDVTNPLGFTDRLQLMIGHDDSGGEQVQRWAPTARVVKAFNTVGFELMDHPALADGPGTMFIAGDDDEAKAVTTGLAADLGWGVHDAGDLRAARLTEPLAMLWIEHAIRTGERGHAFRLLAPG